MSELTDTECSMFKSLPSVSDQVFERVLFDIQKYPMTTMHATAARTTIPYRMVAKAVQYMVMDGTVIRRRIGKGAGRGVGSTFANLVLPSKI